MIGPLKILNPAGPRQKFEAQCHLCSWTFFKWTIAEAEELLEAHLQSAHINPPKPWIPRAEEMPGYGAGCNS